MIIANKTIELSYFSLQLLDYLSQNHPHLTGDYDFIKMRGDAAALAFEKTLSDGYLQEQALEDAAEELFKGLYFSLHSLIKDILWSDFSHFIPADKVEEAARRLYPFLKHLHKPFDTNNVEYGMAREAEFDAIDEDELRLRITAEISKIVAAAEAYGI